MHDLKCVLAGFLVGWFRTLHQAGLKPFQDGYDGKRNLGSHLHHDNSKVLEQEFRVSMVPTSTDN